MANDKVANARVRAAMAAAGVSQGELAEILGLSGPALSIMLGVELSNTVQREIIAKIKEAGR